VVFPSFFSVYLACKKRIKKTNLIEISPLTFLLPLQSQADLVLTPRPNTPIIKARPNTAVIKPVPIRCTTHSEGTLSKLCHFVHQYRALQARCLTRHPSHNQREAQRKHVGGGWGGRRDKLGLHELTERQRDILRNSFICLNTEIRNRNPHEQKDNKRRN
jgi:hypothetical protein